MTPQRSCTRHNSFLAALFVVALLLIPSLLSQPASADALDVHCSSASSKDSCYKEVAIQRKDVDICDRITSDSVKNSCLSKLAFALNNMDMCRGIKKIHESSEDRAECYMEFVDGIEDYPICDQYVRVDKYYDECIDKIYDETKTLEVCLYYVSPKKAISCIKKIAKKQHDQKICNHLEKYREERTSCTRIATASRACTDEMGIDDHMKECLAPFYEEVNQIDNKCNDYGKAMELKFRQKEHGKYFFSDETGLRNQIEITLLWVDQKKETVDIMIHQDQEEMTFREIPLGYVVTVNKVNVQPLQLTEEDYNGEKHNFANVCVFKTGTQGNSEDDTEQEMVIEDIGGDDDGDDGQDSNDKEGDESNEEPDETSDDAPDNEEEDKEDNQEAQTGLDSPSAQQQKQQKKQPVLIRFLKWITSFI